MRFYSVVVQSLGLLTLLALAGAAFLFAALVTPPGRAWLDRTFSGLARHPLSWACLVAGVATAGSLYLSEVAGLLPCRLCWYQRIAMYPLVALCGVAWIRGDAGVWRYVLPLGLGGVLVSAYHVALQLRPGLEIVACDAGNPCSARYVAVLGFVSIPWMAGAAFLLISALVAVAGRVEVPAGAADG